MKRRQILLLAAKATVGIALLVAIVVFARPAEVVRVASDVRLAWLLAALVLLPLNLWLEVELWRPILRLVAPAMSRRRVTRAVLAGFTLGLVTPANVGDFVGRAMLIPTHRKWETGVSAAAVRLPELLWMIVVGLIGLAFVRQLVPASVSTLVPVAMTLGAGVAIVLAVLCFAPSGSIRRLDGTLGRYRAWRHVRFMEQVPKSTIARVLLLAGLRYLVFSVQFVFCLYAFGPIGPSPSALAAPIAATFLLRALVPSVTLANMGIREGIAVFFLGLIGVSGAVAFNGAFLLFVVNVAVPALLGLPFLMGGNLRAPSPGLAGTIDGIAPQQQPIAVGDDRNVRMPRAETLVNPHGTGTP